MFREMRQKNGYTTEFVSKQLKIKKTTLYKIEKYHALPSLNILLKMQEIYKCEYAEIINSYRLAKGVFDERKCKKEEAN